MNDYKIVRYHFNGNKQTIKTELTLEQAQAHCQNPETSSSTCKSPNRVAYTKRVGKWFDGYTET